MSYRIGSAPECDIVFNSPKVSRLHAEIAVLNSGDILLKDKNSTNGTFVNNRPIQPDQWVNIRRGDLIRFADMELQWASVPQIDNSMFKKIFGIGKNAHYNEIVANGNTVSDFHATLKIDKNGHAFIEDHSLNGTAVNGNKIVSHQNIRIKRNDDVVVGGVPVNLKKYIPADPWSVILKVVGSAAAVAAIVALVVMLWPPDSGNKIAIDDKNDTIKKPDTTKVRDKSDNPSMEDLFNATAFFYGEYYVDVLIKNNPFSGRGVPDKWRFGWTGSQWVYGAPNPFAYTGTAFFISPNGEMGTNRHVACPWTEDAEDPYINADLKTKMQVIINDLCKNYTNDIAKINYLKNRYNVDVPYNKEVAAMFDLLKKSDFDIEGHHKFLGVVLPGQNFMFKEDFVLGQSYVSTEDFMTCQVIAESNDPNKDVALLRLNDPKSKTPDFVKNGGYYRIENARNDETQFKLGEQLSAIGYPTGDRLGFMIGRGKEMTPTYTSFTVAKKPDEDQFQVQGVSLGGNSGSPVIDSNRNLVGVLWGGLRASDNVTFICNIKHLTELYNNNKLKK